MDFPTTVPPPPERGDIPPFLVRGKASMTDSGYLSQADLVEAGSIREEDALGNGNATRFCEKAREQSDASSSSWNPDSNPSMSGKLGLQKSNSTASAGRSSIKSHVSLPVTGTIPYGSLQLLEASESPSPEREGGTMDGSTIATAATIATSTGALGGDIFLILDLPAKFTLGHDKLAVTAENSEILGIRDIPPGAHFLWVAAPGSMISRCGYWYIAAPDRHDIHVKQWDRYNETLGDPASQFEARERRRNIASIYPKLLPHDYRGAANSSDSSESGHSAKTDEHAQIWQQLTSAISAPFLDRVTGKKTQATATVTATEWLIDSTDGAKGEMHDFFPPAPASSGKFLRTAAGSELGFLFLPPDNNSSSVNANINLNAILVEEEDNSSNSNSSCHDERRTRTETDLIAELQFAFVTGAHLGNFACLEHWWFLVLKVILRNPDHSLVLRRPALCRRLLQTLHAQLRYNDSYISSSSSSLSSSYTDSESWRSSRGEGEGEGEGESESQLGILGIAPRRGRKLRDALALYKRRLDETLLGLGDRITPEQAGVGHAFVELETWVWKYGWDLRRAGEGEEASGDSRVMGYGNGRRHGHGHGHGYSNSGKYNDDDDDGEEEESGEYAPVIVDLDDSGREVGLVSWK